MESFIHPRKGTTPEWLNPSIINENDDPTDRGPELDLYSPDNPDQPPYPPEFLERCPQPQIARKRRITKRVEQKLTDLESAGPMTNSRSSYPAPWPTRAGLTPPSIRTIAPRGRVDWAILKW